MFLVMLPINVVSAADGARLLNLLLVTSIPLMPLDLIADVAVLEVFVAVPAYRMSPCRGEMGMESHGQVLRAPTLRS